MYNFMFADQRAGLYKSRRWSHGTSVYVTRIYDITYNIKAASTIYMVHLLCVLCGAQV